MKQFFLIFSLLTFSIFSYGQTYPASKGNSTGYEYISNVSFNTINKNSTDNDDDGDGDDGYDDFTGVSTNVNIGDTYTLSVTISADSKDYITAWIDWNDDGVFTDSGEDYVIVSNTSSDGPHTVNITVPSNVIIADLRMRVSLKWDGTPTSDETFSYGEVEDYTIHIKNDIIGIDGPGGVGKIDGTSPLVLWLDANTISATNASTVTTWNDESGNNFDLTVGNGATYNTNVQNGYPAFNFDGSTDYFERAYEAKLNPSSLTIFSANNVTSSSNYKALISNRDDPAGAEAKGFILYSRSNDNYWQFWNGSTSSWEVTNSETSTVGNWASQTAEYQSGTDGKKIYVNGEQKAQNTHTLNKNTTRPIRVGAGRNENTPDYYYQGDIGEIIMYDEVVNSTQRIIIQNYLAAKYNYTLVDNDIYTMDNSSNGNYDHEVAGIGRVNQYSYHDDAKGTGIIRILNPSGLGDDEFLLWGHNNSAQTFSNTADIPSTTKSRYERVWRVSEVNTSGSAVDVGSIEMRWDLSGQSGFTTTDLRLLIDTDNDGSFADETPISGATSLGNNIYSFTGVTAITNERRFTLGLVSVDYADTDGDGVIDRDDIDDDNDGITDATEAGVACTTTEVYCGAESGKLYKIDFNAETVTLMTTSTQTSEGINALASNPDDGVVYYGVGTIMYVYNPADGTHAVLKDFASEVTGANLESGGGAYFNGYLYFAPEDGSGYGTNIYKTPISNNGLTAGTAVSIGNPSGTNKGYGDFVVINEGSAGMMYGQTSGSSAWEFWKYDLSTNTRTVIKSGSGGTWQLALDLYGRLWRGSGTSVQKLDFDGNTYGDIITTTDDVYDMTGPFNCVQGDLSLDTDGDGVPNIIDLDSDGDGIPDNVEGQSTTGYTAPSGTDTDGDGLDDAYDPDNGGSFIGEVNTDNDGDNDFLDINSDNNGNNDTQEAGLTLSGNDSDGDGLDDNVDATSDYSDPNGTINTPSSLPDSDGDVNTGGDVDYRDNFNGDADDHDGDGIPDEQDIDDDNDGLTDAEESGVSCDITEVYVGGTGGKMYKVDFDAGTTTLMTTSTISGIDNINALASNPDDNVVYYGKGTVMYVYDPSAGTHSTLKDFSSEISDGNLEGAGAAYYDGYLYIAPEDGSGYGTHIYKIPISNNGMTAGTAQNIASPVSNQSYGDFVVSAEVSTGVIYGSTGVSGSSDYWKYDIASSTKTIIASPATNPYQIAVDLYGRKWGAVGTTLRKIDANGAFYGNTITLTENAIDMTGPYNCAQGGLDKDTDGDGIPDRLDLDSDNDGIADVIEAGGSDPDNDGVIGSGAITDTDGDGWSNITDSDNGGTALSNPDTDGDGYPNSRDIDSDNDGIVDNIEGQATDSYTAPSGITANSSGWDNSYNGNTGGTAIVLTDTEGDGTPDYIDTNSDDDGGDDATEAYDTDKSGTTNTPPTNTDSDGDGLDDAYDVDGTSTTDNGGPTNNNQTANSFPNDDNSTTDERDWREVLSTLPVTLISFDAVLIDDYVELNWATASEINNDYFIVQRSINDIDFEDIDRIAGNGNSNIIIEYQSYDMNLLEGILYYRLKQVDYDGTTDYSNVVAIRNNLEISVEIYPNPSNGIVNIETKEAIEITIFSTLGKEIYHNQFGANTVNQIDISNNPKGVYIISYKTKNNIESKKLILR